MFSIPRFGKFLRWLWHRSPLWYAFVPFAAAFALVMFIYFGVGPNNDFHEINYPYFDLEMVMPLSVMGMLLGGLPIAIHFCSRHLAKPDEGIAYLSLPVSTLERYLSILLGLFVIIPIWTFLCICAFYGILNACSGLLPYPIPSFAHAVPFFKIALLPYFAGAVFALGVNIIRPKQAFVWNIGVATVLSILFPLIVTNFEGTNFLLDIPVDGAPITDSLVGRTVSGEWHTNTNNYAFNNSWTFILPAIVATLGFAAVAYLGLRHKQV